MTDLNSKTPGNLTYQETNNCIKISNHFKRNPFAYISTITTFSFLILMILVIMGFGIAVVIRNWGESTIIEEILMLILFMGMSLIPGLILYIQPLDHILNIEHIEITDMDIMIVKTGFLFIKKVKVIDADTIKYINPFFFPINKMPLLFDRNSFGTLAIWRKRAFPLMVHICRGVSEEQTHNILDRITTKFPRYRYHTDQ